MNKPRFLKILVLALTAILLGNPVSAQDQDDDKKLFMNGYLKDMLIADFSLSDSTLWTNLVHNRLNFKWYPNDTWSAILELRTQWYHGDYVRLIPNFGEVINETEDFFDWSWVWENENNVFTTMVDRGYVEYQNNNWDVKLGRQRINWGVSIVWNPNDLFNAFSYTDFDYEERPGTDALRIQRYYGFASSIELAANLADNLETWVIAGKWGTNKGGYDLQVIGGLAREDITLGGAWAGNLKLAGFKGEFTLFIPVFDNPQNTAFVGTMSYDYSFKNSIYINTSYLFNSDGALNLGAGGIFDFYGQLTARNLSPYKHNVFVLATYPFHPLVNGSLSLMVFPGNPALFASPGVTFSVVQNLDLDFILQTFYGKDLQGDFRSISRVLFTRLKWSF